MIIDVHTHLGYHEVYSDPFIAGLMGGGEALEEGGQRLLSVAKRWLSDANGDRLVAEMDRAGVSRSVLLMIDAGVRFDDGAREISRIYELYRAVGERRPDRFVIFGGVDPRRGPAMEELFRRSVVEWRFGGMKLYPPMGFAPSDPALNPYLDLCAERGLPILIHTGASLATLDASYGDPRHVAVLAKRRPELKIIMAHGGYNLADRVVREVLECPNVWVDLAGFQVLERTVGSPEAAQAMSWAFRPELNRRVLFGSDYPLFHFSRPIQQDVDEVRHAFHASGCQDAEALERVLWRNAAEVLGVDEGARENAFAGFGAVALGSGDPDPSAGVRRVPGQPKPEIRPMAATDLEAVMALVAREGWRGYVIDDLRLILAVSPEHCFKAVCGERLVGSVFALTVGGVSCVSFFIIDQGYRSFGLGRALGLTCLEAARRDARLLVTYANRRAVAAYERVGFRPRGWVNRYVVSRAEGGAGRRDAAGDLSQSWADVAGLDAQAHRHSRQRLLDVLQSQSGVLPVGYRRRAGGPLQGGLVARRQPTGWVLGPVLAADDRSATDLIGGALDLLEAGEATMELKDDRLLNASQSRISLRPTGVSVLEMHIGDSSLGPQHGGLVYAAGGHHFS